jgi:DNA (cytosine-5)-methyltransferase 1
MTVSVTIVDATVRPRLLDLFCCQGGASMGYHRAGFEVTGVDINPQPRYPFLFYKADAIEFVKKHGHKFDAIHASPPCQAHSKAQRIQANEHPDLIEPTREALQASGRPWVIENVVGAPLLSPVELCGAMFGLRTYRHRLFETSFTAETPEHPEHTAPLTKMGRPLKAGEFMHIVGHFTGTDQAREIMAMPWATREGLREAIPPAYTAYLGRQLIGQL